MNVETIKEVKIAEYFMFKRLNNDVKAFKL